MNHCLFSHSSQWASIKRTIRSHLYLLHPTRRKQSHPCLYPSPCLSPTRARILQLRMGIRDMTLSYLLFSILHFVQFVLAITVIGLYGTDLDRARQAGVYIDGKWVCGLRGLSYLPEMRYLSIHQLIVYATYRFTPLSLLVSRPWPPFSTSSPSSFDSPSCRYGASSCLYFGSCSSAYLPAYTSTKILRETAILYDVSAFRNHFLSVLGRDSF